MQFSTCSAAGYCGGKAIFAGLRDINLSDLLLKAVPILWALTVHECAHAWVAYKCGDSTALYKGRVSLNPLAHLDVFGTIAFFLAGFGWAKPVPVNPYNFRYPSRDSILVSIAGVTANLLSALAFAGIFRLLPDPSPGTLGVIRTICFLSVVMNLSLLFFNLIPLPPLDGSHVLEELLPWRIKERFWYQFVQYGPFLLLGLVFLGGPLLGYIIGTPVWFITRHLLGLPDFS